MERFDSYDKYEDFLNKITFKVSEGDLYSLFPSRDPHNKPVKFEVLPAKEPYQNSHAQAQSTFIRRIRYFPYMKRAYVTIGKKRYLYPMSAFQLAHWMKSDSLGRFYNNYIKIR